MKVRDLMKSDLKTVTKDCTLKEAASLMQEVGTGVLPVLEGDKSNPGRRPIGVLTDRDIVVRCISLGKDPNDATVGEAYTADTVFCDENDSEQQAFDKMRGEGVGRILVRSSNEELAGIVSMADIIAHVPNNVWDNIEENASNTNTKFSRRQSA